MNSIHAYNILFSSFCKNRDFEKALNFLSDLISKNIMPNEYTYKILMEAYWKADMIEKTYEIYNVHPSKITSKVMMKLFLRSGHETSAIEFLKFLPDEDITIDLYKQMIEYFAIKNDINSTLEWIKKYKSTNQRFDSSTFNIILKLFLKKKLKNESLKFLKEEVENSNYIPTLSNLNLFISYYYRTHDIISANEIIQKFKKEFKINLSIIEYNIMIEYYLFQLDKEEEALNILNQLKN